MTVFIKKYKFKTLSTDYVKKEIHQFCKDFNRVSRVKNKHQKLDPDTILLSYGEKLARDSVSQKKQELVNIVIILSNQFHIDSELIEEMKKYIHSFDNFQKITQSLNSVPSVENLNDV